jgi:hypothetical protein
MYIAALFIHSWFRWLVFAAGLWLLVAAIRGFHRGALWSARDERANVIFLAVLDLQVLIGLLLYFALSPVVSAAHANMGAAMKDATLRFFAVEHIITMLIAVAVAHIGRVRAKKKLGPGRYRTTLVFQTLWLILTLLSIPWPGLDIARPLFRM